MNGHRLKITWNTSLDESTLSASVMPAGGDEVRGMAIIRGESHYNPAHGDRTMLSLIKNLSEKGWATRIIDDNEIEVVRLALPADIKYEQRCKA